MFSVYIFIKTIKNDKLKCISITISSLMTLLTKENVPSTHVENNMHTLTRVTMYKI